MKTFSTCPICGRKPLATFRGKINVDKYQGAMRKVAEDYLELGRDAQPEEVVSVCGGCRALYRAKFFDEGEVEKIYGSLYRDLEAKLSGDVDFAYDNAAFKDGCAEHALALARRIESKHGAKVKDVFDIGGRDGFRLKRLAAEGYTCAVFDPIDTPVCDPRVRKERRWSHEIPDHEKADLILLCNVLEHSIDPYGLIKACHSHLRDGGFLYVELPSDIETVFDWLALTRWRGGNLTIDHTHHVFYSKKSVRHLLVQSGFETAECRFSRLPVIGVTVLETLSRKDSEPKPSCLAGVSLDYDLLSSGHFPGLVRRALRKVLRSK